MTVVMMRQMSLGWEEWEKEWSGLGQTEMISIFSRREVSLRIWSNFILILHNFCITFLGDKVDI